MSAAAWAAGAGAASNILGGVAQGLGQKDAVNAALPLVGQAKTNVTQGLAQQQGYLDPYRMAGNTAFTQAGQIAAAGPQQVGAYQAPTFSGVNVNEDPGAKYRMTQALAATNADLNQQGALFSGKQQKALQSRASDLASQEYQNAYARQRGAFLEDRSFGAGQTDKERAYLQGLQQQNFSQNSQIGGQGLSAAGQESTSVGQATAQTNALLGQEADLKAKQAAGMWGTIGSALSGAGNAGMDLSKYYMASDKSAVNAKG